MHRIPPRAATLDGLAIARLLPHRSQRYVGPFLFLDHIGPHHFAAGTGLDVGPHPHIGLATITYVFAGSILHRDSLGNAQLLVPGEVNWMKAGRGVVHSERTPAAARTAASQLHAVQAWMALPDGHREDAPAFLHVAANEVPCWQEGPVTARLLGGTYRGASLPVFALPGCFYVDIACSAPIALSLSLIHI